MSQPNNQGTVFVVPIPGKSPHVQFVWTSTPTTADIKKAFAHLNEVIEIASEQVHVIVDVSSHPKLPLGETLTKALRIQNIDKMGMWLVVGADWRAEFIGNAISNFGKKNLEWFRSQAEAMQRLDDLIQKSKPVAARNARID